MATINIGTQSVEVPDTLDLEASTCTEKRTAWDYESRRQAFLTLFPSAKNPDDQLPVEGHEVFVLDLENSRPVHTAKYDISNQCFHSDGGWFELEEVALWSYVPNAENEAERRTGIYLERK